MSDRSDAVAELVAADSHPDSAADRETVTPGPDLADLVASFEAELVELECRRYTDPSGLETRAHRLLAVCRDHGLLGPAARAELVLTDLGSRVNDPVAAVETARTLLLRARAHGLWTVAARAEAVIAWCLFRMGALGDAAGHAVDAVRLLPADAPAHLRVDHRMILALLNAVQTPDDSFDPVFAEVLTDAEHLANPHLLLSVLNNYAFVLHEHGRPATALPLIARLQELSAASGVALNSTMLDTVACVHLDLGDLVRAEAVATAMIEPGVVEAEVRAHPDALLTLAEIRRQQGAHGEALVLVGRAEHAATARGLPEVTARAAMDKARLLAQAGDYRGAYDAVMVSHLTWVQVRDRDTEARAVSMRALFETEQAVARAAALAQLADHDALTGLWNRRHLDRVLPDLLTIHHRSSAPLSVAIVDVDHFKQVNDQRDHATGDATLTRIGTLLTDLIAAPGFTARLGGEEFVLVFPHTTPADAADRCEAARVLIEQHPWTDITHGLPVTVSIGHATSHPAATVSTLLNDADRALYDAKHHGRNQVRPAPSHA